MSVEKKRITVEGKTYEVRPRTGRRPKGEPPPAGPRSHELGERAEATHRVAPKFGAFIMLGVVLGLISAGIVGSFVYSEGNASPLVGFSLLALLTVPIWVLITGGAALVLDSRSRRAQSASDGA